jgi:uncharacterized protein YqeY
VADQLHTQIREQVAQALKSGDKVRVAALRMLSAAITNREKDERRDLTDAEVREVAGRELKKRTESIEAFEAAGRTELAERERAERQVLAAFAPAQLSDEQVEALIDEAFAATGASQPGDMGKVMGFVMGRAKGQVDGGEVQRRVRERLG